MSAAPTVSVVVPAYRAGSTIHDCVRSLLAQVIDAPFEVVLVVSADHEDELPSLTPSDRLHVLRHVPRLSAAAARNVGAHAAGGATLVFTDADVVAPAGWLAALLAAGDDETVVAGSVVNGTPTSRIGTAQYLVEFLDLHPSRPSRTAWHGATCNLLVPRSAWARYGPFPTDMGGGEDTLLTVAARRDGRFRFAGDAFVMHQNRTELADALRHQYAFGAFTATLSRRCALKHGWLVRRAPLAPVAVVARLVSVYARAAVWMTGRRRDALASLPAVVCLLACWGSGLVAGHRRSATPSS